MLDRLPEPAYIPCDECGESVARAKQDEHVCERERWLDYQLFLQREAIGRFEDDFAAFLAEHEDE
jgi:hypothetical protein